jgi:hypothetical protein
MGGTPGRDRTRTVAGLLPLLVIVACGSSSAGADKGKTVAADAAAQEQDAEEITGDANPGSASTDASMPMLSDASEGSDDLQWPKNKVVGGSADSLCLPGITFADPMLGALADNGGPTLTMLPDAAASVVPVGADCPASDQTGKPRASPCTLGAVEK